VNARAWSRELFNRAMGSLSRQLRTWHGAEASKKTDLTAFPGHGPSQRNADQECKRDEACDFEEALWPDASENNRASHNASG
jgi:hypothetical protein